MLSRRGWPSTLEVGVARDERGVFQAHAWVEHAGQVIVGQLPDLSRFAKLPTFKLPGSGSWKR
jgi:hypothetical protein